MQLLLLYEGGGGSNVLRVLGAFSNSVFHSEHFEDTKDEGCNPIVPFTTFWGKWGEMVGVRGGAGVPRRQETVSGAAGAQIECSSLPPIGVGWGGGGSGPTRKSPPSVVCSVAKEGRGGGLWLGTGADRRWHALVPPQCRPTLPLGLMHHRQSMSTPPPHRPPGPVDRTQKVALCPPTSKPPDAPGPLGCGGGGGRGATACDACACGTVWANGRAANTRPQKRPALKAPGKVPKERPAAEKSGGGGCRDMGGVMGGNGGKWGGGRGEMGGGTGGNGGGWGGIGNCPLVS